MRRQLLPHPLLSLVLALIWLLLNNSVAPGQLVLGALLGWLIPLFTWRYWPEAVPIRKPGILLRLLARLLMDILVANLAVARRILGRPARLRPAFIELSLSLESDVAVSLLANTICLTPGTVSARLSQDRRTLLVHALDAPDPEALAEAIKTRYEIPLKEVFES